MSQPTLQCQHKTKFRIRGYHSLRPGFPACFSIQSYRYNIWANPISLAATFGISVDFFSSGYLDVSVLQVRLLTLCIQVRIIYWCRLGFPIRTSPDQSLFASSPKLFAGYYVLHRLLLPRHPPCALNILII